MPKLSKIECKISNKFGTPKKQHPDFSSSNAKPEAEFRSMKLDFRSLGLTLSKMSNLKALYPQARACFVRFPMPAKNS